MPLLQINARGDRPVTAAGAPPGDALSAALEHLPTTAPIVILVHGYKHAPNVPLHCPHGHVLSLAPRRGGRCLSWPKHLGFGRGDPHEGLAIGFGWNARDSIWAAYREAGLAGVALARLVAEIAPLHPRPVHVFAHSLGARVAFRALSALPAGSVGRIVTMAGAEFACHAEAALARPAGRQAEILNVTSGENLVFDLMFETLLQRPFGRARALGAGLPDAPARWVDLRIDDPATRTHLGRLGFPVAPPAGPVCHWSGYLRPGLFPLYRRLLTDPAPLPLAALRLRAEAENARPFPPRPGAVPG